MVMMDDDMEIQELQPFISDEKEVRPCSRSHTARGKTILIKKNILIHLALIGLYTLAFVLLNYWRHDRLVLSDALRGLNIRIKPKLSITTGESPWVGAPGGSTDDAWHDLVGNTSIRVTDEELRRNGNHQSSVPLPDGGGNLVWLGVFHQIHCLKQFRKLNYLEYFHPNITHKERYHMEVHINHCIEYLRQAVMCNPDTSLTTLIWTKTDPRPVLDVKQFERQCVDWEYFMETITPRVVPFEEVENLVNPGLEVENAVQDIVD